MEDHEIWKPLRDWPYEASSLGRVRNRHHRIRKLSDTGFGYKQVCLSKDGHARCVYVHRLVCEAFFGAPPSPDMEVDHINFDRGDNRVVNLRWLSRKENLARRTQIGPLPILSPEAVAEIKTRPFKYGQVRQFAKKFGVSHYTITAARHGYTKGYAS